MEIYAHRGKLYDFENENTISGIKYVIDRGYKSEIDVYYSDEKFRLGHDLDKLSEEVPIEFLKNENLLVHCKNVQCFLKLSKLTNVHCFYQTSEYIVLTNRGCQIIHSNYNDYVELINKQDRHKTIIVCPKYREDINFSTFYGVITDEADKFPRQEKKIFKLLILDIDGVMTDGTKYYGYKNECFLKNFNDKDFTAIKRFKSSGIKVVFLTGDDWNEQMAIDRNVNFYNIRKLSKQLDKSQMLSIIQDDYKIPYYDMAYVGDDYYDLSIINSLRWTFCPNDAAEIVKKNVLKIIPRDGGHGVIEALYEMYSDKIASNYPYE